ncbi:MAG: alpha-L-fucosidase [Verrucomicrobia bacterium]|nr:alpha-L-fucosidase [Verrucomicrobiota bacterium]
MPSANQLAWQENELTLFTHFGMNTFTGRGIGLGTEDPNLFYPTNLDCRQWVRVAKECGFKGIILTAKHHDGFCLWPTATTRHSVASSRWEDGRGDVVRDLTEACKAGGIKLGIYCSPYDRSVTNYDTDRPAYSRYYRQQLSELLSHYGPVFEMWFDGNKANVADWGKVIALVRKLQPRAVVKQGPVLHPVREDIRWVGNEMARAPLENWSVYPAPDSLAAGNQSAKPIWFPLECDTMMNGHWFWDTNPPRSLATLLNYYYTSVGRNSEFLLNVAPDPDGRFSPACVERLREFHRALQRIFGNDYARGRKTRASNVRGNDPAFGPENAVDGNPKTYWAADDGVTNAWLEVDLGGEKTFNVIGTGEEIALGQRVEKYKVEAFMAGHWEPICAGTTIGYRKLDRFPKVIASRVRLTILASRACPAINLFGVYLDTVSPPESFETANALKDAPRRARRRAG